MTTAIERLSDIMRTLRAPNGCGWDKKQTLATLKKYLLEETYELLDAMVSVEKNPTQAEIDSHREELGDLLLQVVFQAQIQAEKNNFTFEDVAQSIVDKMLRRHPHIFGDEKAEQHTDDNPFWHKIKEGERKNNDTDFFAGISKNQPALMRATKLGERAARVGFDWDDAEHSFQKVREEVEELWEAVDKNDMELAKEELGDLLHALAQMARHLKIDPELALVDGNEKFSRRFLGMISSAGGIDNFKTLSSSAMEELWRRNK